MKDEPLPERPAIKPPQAGPPQAGPPQAGPPQAGPPKAEPPQAASPLPDLPLGDRPPPPLTGENPVLKRRRRRLRRFVAYPLLAALVAAATGVGVAASIRRPQVDTLDDFVPKLITRLYDRDGEEYRTYSRENRILLEEGDVPEVLQNAVLAIEDVNFFQHGGVDLKGVLRAAVTNLRQGKITEGASTITMQLARDLFALTREQNWKRKIEEAFLAVELEKRFSKQQILTFYCNMVNLSNGNYGMEAAARNYFNKSVDDLTLAEAATLAGIPQRPTYHNPTSRPEAVTQRRNVVLSRMLEEELITASDYEAAVATPLVVVKRRRAEHLGPYFSEEVRRFLISTYGETRLYDRGLQVHTTLDRRIQAAAEAALKQELLVLDHGRGWRGAPERLEGDDLEELTLPSWAGVEPLPGAEWYEGLVLDSDRSKARVKIGGEIFELTREGIGWTKKRNPSSVVERGDVAWFRLAAGEGDGEPLLMLEQAPEMEAAVVVIESATGAVRAMVGGWDYERNEFNRVTQAQRQVGSAFKPFVYGAALEIGFTAADTIFDGPVVFPAADQEETYSPRNFYRKYLGILTLRRGLEKSINVPAVKLMDLVGVERVIEFARRCGVTTALPPYPSLALGASDMKPIELAAAYATFANQGIYVEPYLIEKVTSRDGRLMQEHAPRAHKAMEPTIAFLLTSMLEGVAQRGTGAVRLAKLDLATAGKTGTTNRYTDAWFVGFTPRYTLLSWVGYDKIRFLGRRMTGAVAALPIWATLVRRGIEEGWLDSAETFERPPGIIEREIEPLSGLLASPEAEDTIMEVFVDGTEPERTFDRQTAQLMALPWYLQEPFYIPKEGERMPSEVADWRPVLDAWEEKDSGKKKTEPSSGDGQGAAAPSPTG